MSTTLNGTKFSPRGSRVPTHLLETAIRWEATRVDLCPAFGMYKEATEAGALKRKYERRLFEESGVS